MGYQPWFQNTSALPLTHGPHGLWVHSKLRCHTFTRLCVNWHRAAHTSSTHYWARGWTRFCKVKCLLTIMHILNIQMPEKPRRESQTMSQFLQKYSSNVKSVTYTSFFTLWLFHQTAPWLHSYWETHFSTHVNHTRVLLPFELSPACCLPPLNCHLGHVLSSLYVVKHHTLNKSLPSTDILYFTDKAVTSTCYCLLFVFHFCIQNETWNCFRLTGKPQGVAPRPHEGAKVLSEQSPTLLHVWVTRGRGWRWSLVETTLRSIGRGVGHTHGWLRVLGMAEEESIGREEGGGESWFFFCSGSLPEA